MAGCFVECIAKAPAQHMRMKMLAEDLFSTYIEHLLYASYGKPLAISIQEERLLRLGIWMCLQIRSQ